MNTAEFTRAAMPLESLRANAIEYAERGWHLVPLKTRLKEPAIRRWADRPMSVQQVARWWDANPRNNIGTLIPDDHIVLDIDPRNGGADSLATLVSAHGELPPTLTCWSGRGDGGRHLWFRLRQPMGMQRQVLANLPGIDVKLPGRGYVVLPPSIHPKTGQPYRWEPHPVADLPAALLGSGLPAVKSKTRGRDADRPRRYFSVADLMARIQAAPVGERNGVLFRSACDAQRQGDYKFFEKYLIEAATNVGLEAEAILATLKSAQRRVHG
ncbi:bifunctional DNA primase/polymerase [[Mycobacterium] zoologicum]|uniref:bifunctional DNA primase/polymerase n=1 Tax=[Mycobacterium] zoologicum TaxID=2872311 RepID=UPI002CC12660|nr:bifunctional DNA primase/polymerase [Mycolicibacter sp. MYC101]MEB3065398.1 bifunctional DNA primase/polymerase [Mycolicibacter sp. MYC101]